MIIYQDIINLLIKLALDETDVNDFFKMVPISLNDILSSVAISRMVLPWLYRSITSLSFSCLVNTSEIF